MEVEVLRVQGKREFKIIVSVDEFELMAFLRKDQKDGSQVKVFSANLKDIHAAIDKALVGQIVQAQTDPARMAAFTPDLRLALQGHIAAHVDKMMTATGKNEPRLIVDWIRLSNSAPDAPPPEGWTDYRFMDEDEADIAARFFNTHNKGWIMPGVRMKIEVAEQFLRFMEAEVGRLIDELNK